MEESPRPRVAIRTDMEGLTGVVRYGQVTPDRLEYAESRAILMAELGALVEGLLEGGAGSITLYDEHVEGTNVDLSLLPKEVETVCGKPAYREDWAGGLDGACSGLVLHGLHAKAGTSGGTLAHTYEHDIVDLRVNGISCGEIAVEAAIAGEWGVPLWLVVADSAGCREAEDAVPGVRTVATKLSVTADGAVCFPLKRNVRAIREAAEAIMREPPSAGPLRFEVPLRLELDLKEGPFRRSFGSLFPESICEGTAWLEGASLNQVWARYWEMKLAALAEA